MRSSWLALPAVICLSGCSNQPAPERLKLETESQKASYSIGMNIAGDLKRQELDLDGRALAQGIEDALSGGATLLTEEEAKAALNSFQERTRQEQQDKQRELGAKNKAEGDEFLARNKTVQGVVTLDSGLQYKILSEGTGKTPSADSTVVTHYRGTLIDGTEFDSSYGRGQPATFRVDGVIRGWTEALQLMKEGAKWQLFIPASLAYGERSPRGSKIGPNSTLIFEIELLEVKEGR
jgi:FKBP-type peptidyl-prolyl cis-trans isomerase FklB